MSTSVSDTVTDAWSTGTTAVHDLAATAAELAAEMASAAAEQLEDLPEKVAGLASVARGRIRPAPRRTWRPWLYVAVCIAGVLAVAWWWRRRSPSAPAVDIGPDGRPNPVRAHHDTAAKAVGD